MAKNVGKQNAAPLLTGVVTSPGHKTQNKPTPPPGSLGTTGVTPDIQLRGRVRRSSRFRRPPFWHSEYLMNFYGKGDATTGTYSICDI